MSRTCIKLRSSLILLFLPFLGLAQSSSNDKARFYEYLLENRLFNEQITFNKEMLALYKNNPRLSDSIYLNISICRLNEGEMDSVNNSLSMIHRQPLFSSHSSQNYFSLMLIGKQYSRAGAFMDAPQSNLLPWLFRNDAIVALSILNGKNILLDTNIVLSPQISQIRNEYLQAPSHSPFVAGFYSALIPGSGKFYLGYKQQAYTAFVANVLFGAQAAESYFRAGPSSARFILSAGLFGLFYGGNIWGSIILAKKQKRDYQKQLEHEISGYYTAFVGNSGK